VVLAAASGSHRFFLFQVINATNEIIDASFRSIIQSPNIANAQKEATVIASIRYE
jgi:hypothetical protein